MTANMLPASEETIPGVAALLNGDQKAIQHPYDIWLTLLDRAPVYRDGASGRVVVSRHQTVTRILHDGTGTRYGHNMAKTEYMKAFRASLTPADQQMFDDYYAFRN